MRFSISSRKGKTKHSLTMVTDDELAQIYHALPDGHAIKDAIKQHLIDCVTDEQLEDSGATSEREFIENWLNPDPIPYNA